MTLKLNKRSIGLKAEMKSDGVKRFAFETDDLNSLFDSRLLAEFKIECLVLFEMY